jgi:hypothetical protein
MNTTQIERLLTNQPGFQGVYSSDTLPTTPRLLVCNTDPSTKPGEHWIAIYVGKEGCGEYFDSFGRAPNKHFKNYMNKNCRIWTFNKKQLQSRVSAFCGYYCCIFVMFKSKGFDMTKFIRLFTNDTGFNDVMVHQMLCNKM